MPFTEATALPQDSPAVRIFFSGLLILEPFQQEACEVRVHRSASAHHLTIEVRRKVPGRPDEIIMRHVGPLAFAGPEGDPQNPPIHGLFIKKVTNAAKRVTRYTGANPGPNGEESFNLAIDMASADLHNGNKPVDLDLVSGTRRNLLDIDPLGSRPSIFLDDGILHTAAAVKPGLKYVLKQRGRLDKVLPRFAAVIGANIYLDDGESLGLIWRNQGKLERFELTKPATGVSYEIYVVNDPLFENDSITNSELDPKHDEFVEYYKLFNAVPSEDQFRLKAELDPAAPPPEKGSTMIPCMPVGNGCRPSP